MSAAPKFTPGPWVVSESEVDVEVARNGNFIAGCDGGGDDGQHAIDRANARLIAAAPDMYDALQAILDEVAGAERPFSGDSYLPMKFIDAARAALARARGES